MYSNGGGFSINRGSTPVCRSKPVTAACRAVILHFPTACCPGALYTAVCKQAPSQWPVLSAQTDAALLCPGKRICPFTVFIIAGCQAEVKAAGFFRPFPFTSSASCAIIYFIKGKAAARAALGCRERKKRGFLMSKTIIPANYTPALNLYDTQRAIGTVKRLFADTLCATLNLYRVSAPLFVEALYRPERRPERRRAASHL